jgi:hypothetical protein
MAWSSGVYTLYYGAGKWANDAASNLAINATSFDTSYNDFATALNNCLTKDGLNKPASAMTWGLTSAQVLALTRGSDGLVFSVGRTGGSNNPVMTFSTFDANGLLMSMSSGNLLLTETLNGINASKNVATYETGTFIGTLTGCTTAPTATFYWCRAGDIITISLGSNLTATSNAVTLTVTGLPAALQPARQQQCAATVFDNGSPVPAWVQVLAGSGTITFLTFSTSNGNGWTNSGTKGPYASFSITYKLT